MITGVDLFSGAGGLSLGAKMAGITTLHAVEFDKMSSSTYQFNHPSVNVITEDICDINFSVIDSQPFVLYGGPPCQGFSTSNTKNRNLENTKNHLFHQFVRAVKELNPYWIVFENVEGITTLQKGIVLEWLKEAISKFDPNYIIRDAVLTASDYGVPQVRKRYFLIANRDDIDFEFPRIHDTSVTVGEAICDLPSLKNGDKSETLTYKCSAKSDYAKLMRGRKKLSRQNLVSENADYIIERYKHIPPGGNWKNIPDHLMRNYTNKNNCHSGIYRRLDTSKPSCVISNYRKNMLIHPEENRGLSVREAARLQSFPDWFMFQGTLENIQQQIGNAVPPLLAKAVFDQILSYYEYN
ncbi:MAG: DNA cytosine methyltransferase [Phaeodactylibacter sp.]|uniref:DNA cytosine methyltransferase n=1 Tax=Phaeodactylibacter sp. TaxID=1940289 RepID=UPI0032EBC30D